ncbi:MAG: serine hydrolase [Candidatus Eremiobacteraeota bacterium]|nr:serine hydrolase [Candidatus Eremiobacteraeota bacterium]MBV8435716.1 serine hydrolase [Candidatus Eremiobacteraeota bacterium]
MKSRCTPCFAILFACALVVAACSSPSSRNAYVPEPFQATVTSPHGTVTIVGSGKNSALDSLVVSFMETSQVPNAELAVSSKGKTIFSHAYTNTAMTKHKTETTTIMRLASNSKAWVDAAMFQLISSHKVNPKDKVFAYLGITKPLPASAKVDPRVFDITIQNMIDHKSGWDDSKSNYDPTFSMRTIALNLGLTKEVNQTQYVQAQLPQPLQEAPGTTYAYCNFCYTVLGMVIAKASGMSFPDYVAKKIAAPLKLHNVLQSRTLGKLLHNEINEYYSAYTGLSAVYVTSSKQYPYPYGGDGMVLEVAGGASALATNAESELAFMNHYIIWGTGTPEPGADWQREGSMPGTNTWAEQGPNGVNYAFLVNTRQYDYGSNPNAFADLQGQIEKQLSL